MMRLEAEESDLIGQWIVVDGGVVCDEASRRIEWLIRENLEKIAGGGWETLYRDREDGRYWELTYPHSEWHGGGPPRLTNLSADQARVKYDVK